MLSRDRGVRAHWQHPRESHEASSKMHELFLTASVKSGDFDTACAILQGLSWMTARRTIYRILFFAGQPQPKGLPKPLHPSTLPRQQEKQLWADLNKQLLRSSYILQATYEVAPEVDFGKESTVDLNRLPATLRWTDLPDPLRDSPITSRKKIEIPFPHSLPGSLVANGHTYGYLPRLSSLLSWSLIW